MGYRFTLESANTVANLSFGKVLSCYRDIRSSEEGYWGFMSFLEQFEERLYSNEQERYHHSIRRLRKILSNDNERYRNRKFHDYWDDWEHHDRYNMFKRDEKVLDALSDLSDLFSRCKIKSLLLPRSGEYSNFDFMLSFDTMRRILKYHPGDSCLILQPEEPPKQSVFFDAFPNFDVALRQADVWPAVLFWDGREDFVFVPVKHEDELLYLYEIVRYERHPLSELKRAAERKKKTSSHYIFQLSDLHFGARNIDIAERRLRSILKAHIATFDVDDTSQFVVTGDAVDSPKGEPENDYRNFSEYLEERCGEMPIRVLGNHDIDNHGISLFCGRKHLANLVGNYPKIEILEDQKVILLLFNSNTTGEFAKGEIGRTQMSEMGNLLDGIEKLNDYLLIAVLHHHLLPIPSPDYRCKKWFEKIFPDKWLDKSLELIDATLFMEWLSQRGVKLVLHGHKHIPFKTEHDGVHVISCGSSTGKISHKEKGKTYMSYNLLKISEDAVTVTLFAEELPGGGAKHIFMPETVRLREVK